MTLSSPFCPVDPIMIVDPSTVRRTVKDLSRAIPLGPQDSPFLGA
jgi:hypothetical protein